MWRKCLVIGIGCAFGVILLTQSASATDTALTAEEFRADWQDAQDSLTGKWIKIFVYGAKACEGDYWRHCELEIEEKGSIKKGKYVENNGDTTIITGGGFVNIPNVGIAGTLLTKTGDVLCVEGGAIVDGEMYLGLVNCKDPVMRAEFQEELNMLSNSIDESKLSSYLSRHKIDPESAFPGLTSDTSR